MFWFALSGLLVGIAPLPVVAIDAGHGGTQEGATGICGIQEKNVTLALAQRVDAILRQSGLAAPLMVRQGDETLALNERAARANAAEAALFVSIHANASPSVTARGIETFFLSNRAATGRLAHLADRENDGIAMPVLETHNAALQRILLGLSLDAAHSESQALALKVQTVLSDRLHSRGRGVLQAPFMVLLGAQMAAVLVEVGFLTHPEECALLAAADHQDAIAEAIATAVLAHLAIHSRALAQQ